MKDKYKIMEKKTLFEIFRENRLVWFDGEALGESADAEGPEKDPSEPESVEGIDDPARQEGRRAIATQEDMQGEQLEKAPDPELEARTFEAADFLNTDAKFWDIAPAIQRVEENLPANEDGQAKAKKALAILHKYFPDLAKTVDLKGENWPPSIANRLANQQEMLRRSVDIEQGDGAEATMKRLAREYEMDKLKELTAETKKALQCAKELDEKVY